MTPSDMNVQPEPQAPPVLVRFVTEGLLATIDSYLAGRLPLHRLVRELHVRIDALAELRPPVRTLTRLRWLRRDVERVHAVLADDRRAAPTPQERDRLAVTVGGLRSTLAALMPPNPLDPAGAARPGKRVRRVAVA